MTAAEAGYGPIVDVRAVSRSFSGGGATVQAVRDVSLAVPRGEFLANPRALRVGQDDAAEPDRGA